MLVVYPLEKRAAKGNRAFRETIFLFSTPCRPCRFSLFFEWIFKVTVP
jgi:hypothetical protein